MKRLSRKATIVGLFAGMLLFAALLTVLLVQPARAQEEPEGPTVPEDRFIVVSGQARVAAEPDQATVRLGVVTQDPEAVEALEQNRLLIQEVISATTALEIPEEQIQTEVLRLSPVQEQVGPEPQTGPPEISAFEARNVVSVTVEDLEMLGDLIDAVTAAGANVIQGINFEVTNRDELVAEARRQAIMDARNTAETLLAPLDAELGNVMVVRSFGGQPVVFEAEQVAQDVGGAAFPIQTGRQFIEASVEVTWEINVGATEAASGS